MSRATEAESIVRAGGDGIPWDSHAVRVSGDCVDLVPLAVFPECGVTPNGEACVVFIEADGSVTVCGVDRGN